MQSHSEDSLFFRRGAGPLMSGSPTQKIGAQEKQYLAKTEIASAYEIDGFNWLEAFLTLEGGMDKDIGPETARAMLGPNPQTSA